MAEGAPQFDSARSFDLREIAETLDLEKANDAPPEPSNEEVKQFEVVQLFKDYKEATEQAADEGLARAELESSAESPRFTAGDTIRFSGLNGKIEGKVDGGYVVELDVDGQPERMILREQDLEYFDRKQEFIDTSGTLVRQLVDAGKISASTAEHFQPSIEELAGLLSIDSAIDQNTLTDPENGWVTSFFNETAGLSPKERADYLQNYINSAHARIDGRLEGSLSELFDPNGVQEVIQKMKQFREQQAIDAQLLATSDQWRAPLDVLTQLQHEGITNADLNEELGYEPGEAEALAEAAEEAQILLLVNMEYSVRAIQEKGQKLIDSANEVAVNEGNRLLEIAQRVWTHSVRAMQPVNERMAKLMGRVHEHFNEELTEAVQEASKDDIEPEDFELEEEASTMELENPGPSAPVFDESQIPEVEDTRFLHEKATPDVAPPTEAAPPPGFERVTDVTLDLDRIGAPTEQLEKSRTVTNTLELETEFAPGSVEAPSRDGTTQELEADYVPPTLEQESLDPRLKPLEDLRTRIEPALKIFERPTNEQLPAARASRLFIDTFQKLSTMDNDDIVSWYNDAKSWNPLKRRRGKKKIARLEGLMRQAEVMLNTFNNRLESKKQAA